MSQVTECAGGCGFFGNNDTLNRCSKCYREYMQAQGKSIPPSKGAPQAAGKASTVLRDGSHNEIVDSVTIQVRLGDLTLENVDCIVNAANSNMDHTGGLALAIVKAGGRYIQDQCDRWIAQNKGPCAYGLVMTTSHDKTKAAATATLACKHVIHCAGPQWRQGNAHEDLGGPQKVMAKAIRNCLKAADDLRADSIAFPAISSGIFGYPKDLCASQLFEEVAGYFKDCASKGRNSGLKEVRFTNFDQATCDHFTAEFDKRANARKGLSSGKSGQNEGGKDDGEKVKDNREKVSEEELVALLGEEYDMKVAGEISHLPSYDDQNVRFTATTGQTYVMKIHNMMTNGQSLAILECQNMLLRLMQKDGIVAPMITAARSGRCNVPVPLHPTKVARLLTYLKGEMFVKSKDNVDVCTSMDLADAGEEKQEARGERKSTQSLFTKLGTYIGRMARTLEQVSLSTPGSTKPGYDWDLENVHIAVAKFVDELPVDKKKTIMAFYDHYMKYVRPFIDDRLPKQMIHGDINDYNVIVCPHNDGVLDAIQGVIDFGDSAVSRRVYDPAVSAGYMMLDKERPLEVALDIIENYHNVNFLMDRELCLYLPLAWMRIVCSVVMSNHNFALDPANEYLLVTAKPGWALLDRLLRMHDGDILKTHTTFNAVLKQRGIVRNLLDVTLSK